MAERLGPFALLAAQPHWGSGWFAARVDEPDEQDLPARVLVRAALPGEAPSLAREGAQRTRLQSPHVPVLLRRGLDEGRAWMCFRPVVAVPVDALLDEPLPVPLALHFATSLAEALVALEAARPPEEPRDPFAPPQVPSPVAPSFDELLVSRAGDLVVTTPPPGTRMALPGLLKVPRRDRFLHPPEGLSASTAATVYAVGSVLHQLLTAADPFASTAPQDVATRELVPPRDHVDDIPARVDDVVRRAMARDPRERFETIDELVGACAQAAADYPPLEDAERAALLFARAGWRFDQSERFFT